MEEAMRSQLSKRSSSTSSTTCSDDDGGGELRRGPWTAEEDSLLIHYISSHGEGRWNLLAKRSGLKRTGKSCRLRWLNYLKPDVKRGNLSPEEQLFILDLHSKWGNRWSRIAQCLPGRTDNEIKNYWRTRVQKQARHLKIDSNSPQFQELIRSVWMPRLLQKVQEHNPVPESSISATHVQAPYGLDNHHHQMLYATTTMENTSSSSPSSMSSSESTNISSSISHPQISEFSENPIYPIDNNFYGTHSQNGCYNVDSICYDIETLSSAAPVIDSIGPANYSGQNNWLSDEMGYCLWNNLDEFWQQKQSTQERCT